ncbi:MAG: DUF488 family protein [Verrucomicrobia bacterium]|nr:DUF488 family protein [Verrucomicrobiota bacterium]
MRTQRVYAAPAATDGARYLVDRLWPRGLKKEAVSLAGWLKDVAPSAALRQWFRHQPAKWAEFQRRYIAELDARPAAWEPLLEAARRGPVTLVFGARDQAHNNAVALKAYLEKKLTGFRGAGPGRPGWRSRPSGRRR